MSNWMGVSGATRASNESTERAGDGSEPTELMLLARATQPLLEKKTNCDGCMLIMMELFLNNLQKMNEYFILIK